MFPTASLKRDRFLRVNKGFPFYLPGKASPSPAPSAPAFRAPVSLEAGQSTLGPGQGGRGPWSDGTQAQLWAASQRAPVGRWGDGGAARPLTRCALLQDVLHRHALYLIIRMVCYDDGLGAGRSLLALKTTDASNEEFSLWVYQCNSLEQAQAICKVLSTAFDSVLTSEKP